MLMYFYFLAQRDLMWLTEKNALYVVISVMVKRKKLLLRKAASGIARKWGFLHFTLILITTEKRSLPLRSSQRR